VDIFLGVIANAALVIAGSIIGQTFRRWSSLKRVGDRVFQGFGIFVMVMGIQGMNLDQPLFYLACLIIGTAIGELADIDKQFGRLGDWLERSFVRGDSGSNFSKGFVQASLLFCIGSMAFLGALQSGIEHQHTIYYTKGILDGITSVTLSMGFGISVAFSALSLLVYQGLLTLGAGFLAPILTDETVAMCVSVGNLTLVMIGLNMLGITKIKVANLLPSMFIPMIWQAIQLMM